MGTPWQTPEATALRHERIAETKAGRYAEMQAKNFPLSVHPARVNDAALIEISRLTREDSGPEAFIRQQTAIMANLFYDFNAGGTIVPYIGAGAGVAFVNASALNGSTSSTN